MAFIAFIRAREKIMNKISIKGKKRRGYYPIFQKGMDQNGSALEQFDQMIKPGAGKVIVFPGSHPLHGIDIKAVESV